MSVIEQAGTRDRAGTLRLKPLGQQTMVLVGATSGIGLATARAAAGGGARLVLAARDAGALAGLVAEIEAGGGQAVAVTADAGIETDIERVAAAAMERFGGFDTWVNIAAVSVAGQLLDLPTADHELIFRTNYFGVVFGSLTAVRHLRERPAGGALINLGSALSDVASPLIGAYSASKHAVKGFTDALRMELLHDRAPVQVTLIKPSSIDTPFDEHEASTMGAKHRLPPPLYAPELVADAILHAAQHRKRDVAVGAQAAFGPLVAMVAPTVVDWLASSVLYEMQIDRSRPPPPDNLRGPVGDGHTSAPGRQGRRFSLTTAAQLHPGAALGLGALAAGLAVRAAARALGPGRS